MSGDTYSVLGRYSPAGDPDDTLVTVRLLNFPLQLFEQAREHHDDLMREFALLALRPPEERPGRAVPARLLELTEVLGHRFAAARQRTDALRDAAIERGETSMDLTYALPRSAADAMLALDRLMEDADELCREEAHLLTLAATPLEHDFRRWFIEQFTSQIAGADPVPWDGPMRDTPAAL